MKRLLACSAAAAASCLLVSSAAAHEDLLLPDDRYGDADQKSGPCGKADNPVSDVRTTFAPGETITVRVDETIRHPGYFRIAFDDDGDDGFVDPVNADDIYNVDTGTNGVVLLDHWLQQPCQGDCPNPDAPNERPLDTTIYETQVTLPDIECENCTLQVLQIMTDKNGPGDFEQVNTGNDIYYRCANLRLVAGGADAGADPGTPDAGVDPGSPDAGADPGNPADSDTAVSGGCAAGTGAGSAGLVLVGLALAAVRRRRR